MRKIGPTRWAMSQIRRDLHSSMAASALFSAKGIYSASPPRWISDGLSSFAEGILVMQSTQDRTAQNASRCLGGT
jgi:hypothetical protein